MITQAAKDAIRKHFLGLMDEQTKNLRHCALYDLYFGPHSTEYYENSGGVKGWPGYTRAVKILEEWAALHLVGVWVGPDGAVLAQEPDSDPFPSLYLHVDKEGAGQILFDALVSDGGMKI